MTITAKTLVAGVAGRPVGHSLSPLIHNAWLAAGGIDGVYVAFHPAANGLARFLDGLRGGAIRGLNVTLPFKEEALALADAASARADAAAAANLLIFEDDGTITADNTDGVGLLAAFAAQAPGFDVNAGPVALLGAGGAARGAAAALLAAGAPEVRIINRTLAKAEIVAGALSGPVKVFPLDQLARALAGAGALVNATSAGLDGKGELDVPLEATPAGCVVMDLVYRPLETPLLANARALGRPTVDGLEMLIRQAQPSFEAFFGQAPDASVDVRALALAELALAALA